MFCQECGKNIPDDAKFCPGCGRAAAPQAAPAGTGTQNEAYKTQASANASTASAGTAPLLARDGVCPGCGSHECEVQVQQNVTSSGSSYGCCSGLIGWLLLGPFGLLCGLCGAGKNIATTHKSVWVCKKCGKQFPTRNDMFRNFTTGLGFCFIGTGFAGSFNFIGMAASDIQGGAFLAFVLSIMIAAADFYAVRMVLKRNVGSVSPGEAAAKGILTAAEKNATYACLVMNYAMDVFLLLGSLASLLFD